MEYVIETNKLSKKFGEKFAVNDASIKVRKGDIYGLIGRNGAGKTTLMKLLLGISLPTSGDIKLFDSTQLDKQRRNIGSLIEAPAIYKNATAYENLKRFAILAPTSDEKINEILELVGLKDTGKKKAGDFSLGMKQRLGIAIALLGNPEVLILDEPINGLDPAGIKEVRNVILKLNERGVTFLISSHLLDELGKIATNYGIVSDGCIEQITAEELKEKCKKSVKIIVDDAQKAGEKLKKFDNNLEYKAKGKVLTVSNEVKDTAELNKFLVENGVQVYELKNDNMELEDFFIERLGK